MGSLFSHGGHDVPAVGLKRPAALEVARRRIRADPERSERASWLDDGRSVFSDLLSADAPPADAAELADVVLQSAHAQDAESRDRYLGWKHKMSEWFGNNDDGVVERRARQIAAAFLDGAPARVVLDAADELLEAREFNWPARVGGPLAGADDIKRCGDADLHFADGAVFINAARPGVGEALLRHVWRTRPQLTPVLCRWLAQITSVHGTAAGHLDKVAGAISTVAVSEGPEPVLDLVHQWLSVGRARHVQLAFDVLDRLAVHPITGARVRRELTQWATAPTKPERQLAVAAVCRRKLGRAYPGIALKRLQYVLASNAQEEVRGEAVRTLTELLTDQEVGARAVRTVVAWASGGGANDRGRTVFLDLFDREGHEAQVLELAAVLLRREGETGKAVRLLLEEGWQAVWAAETLRSRASQALNRWCVAAESGELPEEAVLDVVGSVLRRHAADGLSDDVHRLIGGDAPLRCELRESYVDAVRRSAAQVPRAESAHAA